MGADFQLKLYFEMYKDYPVVNRDNFRIYFEGKHGKFKYLNELFLTIELYQHKKYGQSIWDNCGYNKRRR